MNFSPIHSKWGVPLIISNLKITLTDKRGGGGGGWLWCETKPSIPEAKFGETAGGEKEDLTLEIS